MLVPAPSTKRDWYNLVDQALEHAAHHERRWIETADHPQLRSFHYSAMRDWWARTLELEYNAKTSNG